MANYLSQQAKWGTQISRNAATFTGSLQAFSTTFTDSPWIVIIQNDTDQTVSLSQDGTNTAISLVAGTKLVLDLRANEGTATIFSFKKGEQWYASGTAGTGLIKISYLYGAP